MSAPVLSSAAPERLSAVPGWMRAAVGWILFHSVSIAWQPGPDGGWVRLGFPVPWVRHGPSSLSVDLYLAPLAMDLLVFLGGAFVLGARLRLSGRTRRFLAPLLVVLSIALLAWDGFALTQDPHVELMPCVREGGTGRLHWGPSLPPPAR